MKRLRLHESGFVKKFSLNFGSEIEIGAAVNKIKQDRNDLIFSKSFGKKKMTESEESEEEIRFGDLESVFCFAFFVFLPLRISSRAWRLLVLRRIFLEEN